MSRPSDPKKLALWRERLERFFTSELGVAPFCAQERVSEASFYHWRKKLGHKGRRRHVTNRRGAFRSVTVVPIVPGAVPGPPAICIQLPCGTRIEVGAEDLDVVRAVVAEVACAGRGRQGGGGSC